MDIEIKKLSEEMKQEAVSLRRELHKRAELSFCEIKTSAYVAEYLKNLGLTVTTGIAKTGVTAFLNAGREYTLLLRADMDALPIEEPHSFDYVSCNKGVMHACGHDAHMAVLLCTAKLLSKLKEKLSVNVLFVFQPGEEDEGGAGPMIAAGILEKYRVKEAIGLHVMNDVPCGKISLKNGPVMASPDDFDLFINGRGGHGAYPHKCINPITIASQVVAGFDAICAQRTTPFVPKLISVCSINGGTFYNIIPDTVHMRGTVRTFDKTVRDKLPQMMEQTIKSVCDSAGATYDFQYNFRYPPLINDETCVSRLEKAVSAVLGEDTVIYGKEPSMGGDDFSYFAEAVPAVYFYLGSGNKKRGITQPLHSTQFDIDEDCLTVGIAAMACYALSAR